MNKWNRFAGGLSAVARWAVFVIFALIALAVLTRGLILPADRGEASYLYTLLLTLAGIAVLAVIYILAPRVTERLRTFDAEKARRTERVTFILLLAVCFIVRLAWVLRFQLVPEVDYYTFYYAAESLAQQYDISALGDYLPRYLALFPHIFGYASFLSLIFKVFGASQLAAAVTNVVLSTISAGLIYYIARKLAGRIAAFAALFIWCFYPSQIMYNMLVLSEPYYTTLFIASVALLVYIRERLTVCPAWRTALIGAVTGAVLSLANSARPIAAIMIIASAIVLFIIQPAVKGVYLGKKALLLVFMCAVYFAGNALNSYVFESRVGEAPATMPGYNMLVGFNASTSGQWSAEDSAELDKYNADPNLSAVDVQGKMMDEAIERITSGEINFPLLFMKKVLVLWSSDSAAVTTYGQDEIPHPAAWTGVANAYYFLTWLLAALWAAVLLRRKDWGMGWMLPLYVVGLTMAQMLVEVAPRYHYSGVFCLALMAAFAVKELYRLSVQRRKK